MSERIDTPITLREMATLADEIGHDPSWGNRMRFHAHQWEQERAERLVLQQQIEKLTNEAERDAFSLIKARERIRLLEDLNIVLAGETEKAGKKIENLIVSSAHTSELLFEAGERIRRLEQAAAIEEQHIVAIMKEKQERIRRLEDHQVKYQMALYETLMTAGFPPIIEWAHRIELSHDGRFATIVPKSEPDPAPKEEGAHQPLPIDGQLAEYDDLRESP